MTNSKTPAAIRSSVVVAVVVVTDPICLDLQWVEENAEGDDVRARSALRFIRQAERDLQAAVVAGYAVLRARSVEPGVGAALV